jgi:DNA adenine methylase
VTSYTGGKGGEGIWQTIINQMPPHRVYIEAFLGAGSILRHKRPAECTIGIERDGHVLRDLWRGDEVPGLELLEADAIGWLREHHWHGDELVYCDPPYLMQTRRCQDGYYRHELTARDHRRLLRVLLALPVPILISGYWSELYVEELKAWRSISFVAYTRRGQPATEWLWMNFPEPQALHDYRWLGRNFREREKITRQQRRWRARLARMTTLQQQALLWAIQETSSTSPNLAGRSDSPEVAIAAAIAESSEPAASLFPAGQALPGRHTPFLAMEDLDETRR